MLHDAFDFLSASDERAWLRARGCIADGSLSCDGESALLSASDERAWLRDRGCIGDGSLTLSGTKSIALLMPRSA